MISFPLKAKYRNSIRPKIGNHRVLHRKFDPPEGTLTFSGGRFLSRARTNSAKPKLKSLAPPRRAYGPFYRLPDEVEA